MRTMKSLQSLLLAVTLLTPGCILLKPVNNDPKVKPVMPKAASADPGVEETDTERVSMLDQQLDCPEDMSVQPGARRLDTRRAPSDRGRRQFAAYHQTPPTREFFVSAKETVDKVVEMEKKQPTLLPAGFRRRLLDEPRNAELRLHVARCELDDDLTRRRASYDAAMALLLGANKDDAMDLLVESTKNGSKQRYISTCGPRNNCPQGQSCDPVHRECISETKKKVVMISATEFEMEHQLSRGLLRSVFASRNYDDNDLVWWAYTRVHRCGGAVPIMCKFTKYNHGGRTEMVHWDLRNGGS